MRKPGEDEYKLLFLLVSTAWSLVLNEVSRVGIPPLSFLPPLLQYTADLCVGVLAPKANGGPASFMQAVKHALTRAARSSSPAVNALVVSVPALDVAGATLTYLSIAHAGSAVFQAFFSGYLVILPLLARIILSRTLSLGEQAGIGIIASGLLYKSFRILSGATTSSLPFGVGAAVGATIVYSFRTVLMDTLVNRYKSVNRSELQRVVGVWGALSTLLLSVLKHSTSPAARAELVDSLTLAGTTPLRLVCVLMLFFLTRMVYTQLQYAVLVGSNGSVDIAFVNSIRTATVTITNSLLYCSAQQPHQCMTTQSASIALIIVTGGCVYALASNSKQKDDR